MARKKPDPNDQALEAVIAAAQPQPEVAPEPEPEPEEAAAAAPAEPTEALFVSHNREPQEFQIMDMPPERTEERRLLWRVPLDKADLFALHHHVVTGRVRRVS